MQIRDLPGVRDDVDWDRWLTDRPRAAWDWIKQDRVIEGICGGLVTVFAVGAITGIVIGIAQTTIERERAAEVQR